MRTFNKIKNIDELLKIAGEELGVINQIEKMIAYANSLQNTQSQQLSVTKKINWDAAAQSQNLTQIFEKLKMATQGFFEKKLTAANLQASLDMSETAIMSIYNLIGVREIPSQKTQAIYAIMENILDAFVEGVKPVLEQSITKQPQEGQQQNYEDFYPEQTSMEY